MFFGCIFALFVSLADSVAYYFYYSILDLGVLFVSVTVYLFIFCQASCIVACDKHVRACVRAGVRVCVCVFVRVCVCVLLWGWIHPLFGGMHVYVRVSACVYTFFLLRVGCCYDGRLESLYRYAPVASCQ